METYYKKEEEKVLPYIERSSSAKVMCKGIKEVLGAMQEGSTREWHLLVECSYEVPGYIEEDTKKLFAEAVAGMKLKEVPNLIGHMLEVALRRHDTRVNVLSYGKLTSCGGVMMLCR